MTDPTDFVLSNTAQFVESALPQSATRPLRILEIGCGTGSFAVRLGEAGHQVLAFDSSPHAVRRARIKGVDAHVVTWPNTALTGHDSQAFDAVLFLRSLHHIRPVSDALDQASRLLLPGGVIVCEELDFQGIDRATATWFFGVLLLLDASGMLKKSAGEFGRRLIEGGGSIDLWREAQDHDTTTAPEIRSALTERFELISETAEPYLYRYAVTMLRATKSGVALARQLYSLEKRMAADGLGRLIGRRFVGRRHP